MTKFNCPARDGSRVASRPEQTSTRRTLATEAEDHRRLAEEYASLEVQLERQSRTYAVSAVASSRCCSNVLCNN